LGSFIDTAADYIPNQHDTCNITIITNTQSKKDKRSITEYILIMQMNHDTIISVEHFTMLQNVNPLRCGGKGSIQTYYDKKSDKKCLLMIISSYKNPVKPIDMTLIHRHFSTMLFTTDGDDTSSKNDWSEVSINRKRTRKSDIKYEKICDNK
jgi:hypothetical protein